MLLTSSSFSSKYWSHWSGTTSLKPSRKALVWPSTPRENLHSAIRLQGRQQNSTLEKVPFSVFYSKCWSNCGYPKPDILLLVLLCEKDIGTIRFEVMRCDFPQNLHVHREVHLQAAFFNVVVPVETTNCRLLLLMFPTGIHRAAFKIWAICRQ